MEEVTNSKLERRPVPVVQELVLGDRVQMIIDRTGEPMDVSDISNTQKVCEAVEAPNVVWGESAPRKVER